MSKGRALERGMRGIKGAEEDSALADLERSTPGKQSAAKPKRKMRGIRIEKSGNGGFISHPDYEPEVKKASSKNTNQAIDYQPELPNTHANKQELLDHIDSSFE